MKINDVAFINYSTFLGMELNNLRGFQESIVPTERDGE